MMKKLLAVIMCMLMSTVLIPTSKAGINTVSIAEVPISTTLMYNWTAHNNSDWFVYNYTHPNYHVYSCQPLDLQTKFTVAKEALTHRGLGETRVNISVGTTFDYGIIFQYLNATHFFWAGIYTLGGNPRFGVMCYNGPTGITDIYANTSDINLASIHVRTRFVTLKVLYNPYDGHVMLKGWDTNKTEALGWNINVTNKELATTKVVQWGLMCWSGTVPNSYFDFWGTAVFNLTYDVRSSVTGYIPLIKAPQINMYAPLPVFSLSSIPTYIHYTNEINQESFLTYRYNNIGYPIGNVYIFTVWNYTVDKVVFLIYDDNDNINSSMDWVSLVFDVNHNHILDAGDKWYYVNKTATAKCMHSYRYNGSAWVATTEGASASWDFSTDGLADYNCTNWIVRMNASEIIPSGIALNTYCNGSKYIGLAIYSATPEWCWNNWVETTETNKTDLGAATARAYNDTTKGFDYPYPLSTDLSHFGDLTLMGLPTHSAPGFINLANIAISSLSTDIYVYKSWAWNVNRFAINTSNMRAANIDKIKVPGNVTKHIIFGWLNSTVPVTNVLFYGLNTTTYQKVLLSPTAGTHQNYTISKADLKTYQVILVDVNPSFIDRGNWFFKWLYLAKIKTGTS